MSKCVDHCTALAWQGWSASRILYNLPAPPSPRQQAMKRDERRNYSLLRKAIRQRLQVHADYADLPRAVCPHVLGLGADGSALALVYQFAGDTAGHKLAAPGSPDNWRCLAVAGLSNIRLVAGDWHSARNYSVDLQSCVQQVDIAITLPSVKKAKPK
jgi:hypothetical protein